MIDNVIENRGMATFGGGCFWCLEPVFDQLRGVESVLPGYAGGHVPHPTYRQVCTKTTGHAEVVQITFDPDRISFRELLEVFFTMHDPTTPNRQGADVGPQYRSVVLYHSPEQRKTTGEVIADMERQGVWPSSFVTEVKPLETFYPAEEEHRNYYRKNPEQGYCQMVIAPKVAKLRTEYMEKLAN